MIGPGLSFYSRRESTLKKAKFGHVNHLLLRQNDLQVQKQINNCAPLAREVQMQNNVCMFEFKIINVLERLTFSRFQPD